MPLPISATEASHRIQEELDLESEEDNHSSDESGEDTEDERIHFELRFDPAEDICIECSLGTRLGLGSISLPPSFVRSLPSANHVTNWGVEWASGRPPKCRRGRRVYIYI